MPARTAPDSPDAARPTGGAPFPTEDPSLLRLAEAMLPGFLLRQRWYPAKDAGQPRVTLLAQVPLPGLEHPAALAVWSVEPPERRPLRCLVPLAILPADGVPDAAVIAPLHPADGGQVLADALLADDTVIAFLAGLLLDPGAVPPPGLSAGRTGAAAGGPTARPAIRRGSVEQSNSSFRVGEQGILKLFRTLEPGTHPELEIGRFLTDRARFPAIPALAGWLELAVGISGAGASGAGAGGEQATLGVLQAFVPNEGDGWGWVLARLADGRERETLPWIAALGRRVAGLHRALALDTDDDAFRPEPVDGEDLDGWVESAKAMARRALDSLDGAVSVLPAAVRPVAEALLARRAELPVLLQALLPVTAVARTRHHGDLHLGQVLVTPDAADAVIVDFEGEPLRPLAERRARHSPLRDVAGMLRSFSYAAASAGQQGDRARQHALTRWAGEATGTFLDAYLAAAEGCPGCAATPEETVRLVRFFMLEKALYEVAYELANRPDWVEIPLAGVLAILDDGEAGVPSPRTGAVRRHRMPFGAELREGGGVRFRLWAPAHAALRLELDGEVLDMTAAEGGWHELVSDRAGPGSRYRFLLPDGTAVPDPASRHQPEDVHGPSEVVDPAAYRWQAADWRGRPWEEAVLYELHIGAFTPEGTFRAAIGKLDHLAALGVTAVQIMPVADFPGGRNWGYDGVLPFAPDGSYGRPEDLKALVDAAHARGLMVMLDVVYNHFGPEGNYLSLYAPGFFTEKHHTPWGAAVNYDDTGSRTVRDFVIHNALYWIEEFDLDGLRLDAVHAIIDETEPHLLTELAREVRHRFPDRHVHLVLENEENEAARLERARDGATALFTAQWNDDVHHGLHVAATGESAGYYGEYAGDLDKLGRALAEGFAFQGEMMAYRGAPRGEPSAHLPPTAFVAFLQNHDQIGNRAFGDRITATAPAEAVRAVAGLYLLAPQVPMLFMGEEWASARPFPFFCDFGPELATAVREGRRKEFARFPEFRDEAARARIPDPTAEATFRSAKLDWEALEQEPHAGRLAWYRRMLALRRAEIVPRLAGIGAGAGRYERIGESGLVVRWRLGGGETLAVAANLSAGPEDGFPAAAGRTLHREGGAGDDATGGGRYGPWAVRWWIEGEPDSGTRERTATGAETGTETGAESGEPGGTALARLATRCGIEPGFDNAHGERVETSPATRRRLLAAMGIDAADEAAAERALDALDREEWQRPLPPVTVCRRDAGPPSVLLTLPAGTGTVAWRVALETGGERGGEADAATLGLEAARELDGRRLERRRLPLPADLPDGYHRLHVAGAEMPLVLSPGRCWLPPDLADGRRLWGLAAQLYTLRSDTDWGIGDFGDLRTLVDLAAARGAAAVGLNPLHAAFPDDPEHASPYSPASRLLLNVLNIDVTAVPEFTACPEAVALVASAEMTRRLEESRRSPLVDYTAVADLKMQVLALLFETCRDAADRGRAEAFATYRREAGPALEAGCLFLVLRGHFAERGQPDWHGWPEEYRSPASPAVLRFAAEHRHGLDFMAWLQWVADDQLAAAASRAREAGMAIGLYRDLAVGADRSGAETWINPQAVVSAAHVGAPPDIFNPAGQDWGLPPLDPHALRQEGYRSFIDLLRANMRHAGGLRIDHAMALQHLYWIPEGGSPADGAYVAYPLEDMLGILALESARHRCLVVGEDLGTVPEGFRERMAAAAVLSYRVLFFEQESGTGAYAAPADYPPLALAVIGSHDLPTLRGWWEGSDIVLKERLGLYPGAGEAEKQRTRRERDRGCLLEALKREGLVPAAVTVGTLPMETLHAAAHAFLARSRAALAMVQLDDLTGETEPVNVPGTAAEYPNWRRKLSLSLEALSQDARFQAVAEIMAAGR